MRATVGPLPPAVYWRRRAVVLGAVLLAVIVLFVQCSGGDDDPATKKTSSEYPTPAPASPTKASSSPTPDDDVLDSVAPGGEVYPDPQEVQSEQAGADGTAQATSGTGTDTSVTQASGSTCADTEMSVSPIPAETTVQRGASLEIRLKIKNTGSRTCTRDVGSDPQELYLFQGAQKYWSSDKCSTAKGNDVQSFTAGQEREYKVTWNGRQSTACTGDQPSGAAPDAGQYQLYGRLGTIISNPVVVTVLG
ncbi:adhesin [Actinoplanes sp. NPDC051851]|uniref:adhesin n=1 Tax=Actinoplanes sp. NPDC051851 TaxID=3154753 RepID=UPI003430E2D9